MLKKTAVRLFVASLCLVTTTAALGFESYYVVNPIAPKGVLDLQISRSSSEAKEPGNMDYRQTSISSSSFGINYSRRVFTNWTFAGGTAFENRNVAIDSYGQTHSISGLSDLSLSAKGGTTFEPMTLTYGALANISPGEARTPYDTPEKRSTSGNNFSGIHSLHPFVGAESYVDDVAVGGRFLFNTYSSQKVDTTQDINVAPASSATSCTVEGFAEFPAYQKVDVGLVASVGRMDLDLARYFEGGNEYKGQIYGQYHLQKDTAVVLSLTALNKIAPIEKSTNEVSLGFRRSL